MNKTIAIKEWAKQELSNCNLGDGRLDRRLRSIAQDLSGNIDVSIYQAIKDVFLNYRKTNKWNF